MGLYLKDVPSSFQDGEVVTHTCLRDCGMIEGREASSRNSKRVFKSCTEPRSMGVLFVLQIFHPLKALRKKNNYPLTLWYKRKDSSERDLNTPYENCTI